MDAEHTQRVLRPLHSMQPRQVTKKGKGFWQNATSLASLFLKNPARKVGQQPRLNFPAIDETTAFYSTCRQGLLDKGVKIHPVRRNHQPPQGQKGLHQRRDIAGKNVVLGRIVPPQIRMDQRSGRAKALQCCGQCVIDITQHHHFIRRRTVRVRGHSALKYVDVARRHDVTHMMIGPSIAQAQLEHRSGKVRHRRCSKIQTGALGHHAVHKQIKAALAHDKIPHTFPTTWARTAQMTRGSPHAHWREHSVFGRGMDVGPGIGFSVSGTSAHNPGHEMSPLLDVKNLSIGFGSAPPVVYGVSFSVSAGETLALVGESGSGKTLTCRSILRILPKTAQLRQGEVHFGTGASRADLLQLSQSQIRDVRGDRISMIFQEPMRSLSPLHRIGNQVAEVLTLHRDMTASQAKKDVLATFERVGFPDPERAFRAYPFELSGGMRQRAMIAMAMVAKPDLLIADEPTTALDVTTQAQVLGLMKDLQRDTGMAMILVTHDLGVVANMADSVVVMNKGHVMESGPAEAVLGDPGHGYTRKLFAAAPIIPEVATPADPVDMTDPILELRNVSKTYHVSAGGWKAKQAVHACVDVNLILPRGKTLAVVGESGSGKTTCARIALGAEGPDRGGEVIFRAGDGTQPVRVDNLSRTEKVAFQRQAQMVFQDPYSSLSPRMRVQEALTEPMEIHGLGSKIARRDKAAEMLRWVGLNPDMLKRYPHAFSGGQRQRLSIARALTLDPVLLVCDEPTSALDVSVQEQILSLLERIRDGMGLSYLFISHDLAVVARIADEVAVMRRGVVVEQAAPETLFYNPSHPYTKALIAAQPEPDISRPIDLAQVAHGAGRPESWPEMYRFEGRDAPNLHEIEPGHKVRCHV